MTCKHPSVLILDHDAPARLGLVEILLRAEWPVVVAATAGHALDCLAHHPFDVALIGAAVPETQAVEAVQEIRRRWPRCLIVASSDGTADPAAQEALARIDGIDAIVSTSWRDAKVVGLVRDLLANRPSAAAADIALGQPARRASPGPAARRKPRTDMAPRSRRASPPSEPCPDQGRPSIRAAWLRNLSDDQLDGWLADQLKLLSSSGA